MKEVFRVEYPNGDGPYCTGNWLDRSRNCDYREHLRAHQNHPNYWLRPRADGIPNYDHRHIFGFESLAQMRAWFDGPERLFLSAEGFVLSCYRIFPGGKVLRGRSQVAFERHMSILYWRNPLNHY